MARTGEGESGGEGGGGGDGGDGAGDGGDGEVGGGGGGEGGDGEGEGGAGEYAGSAGDREGGESSIGGEGASGGDPRRDTSALRERVEGSGRAACGACGARPHAATHAISTADRNIFVRNLGSGAAASWGGVCNVAASKLQLPNGAKLLSA